MQQLSGLDAAFLHLETPRTPMHVGSVSIFKQSDPKQRFTFHDFTEHIRSRLHLSRTFRQRLAELPLNLGLPYWIEDAGFNLNYHLHHVGLPAPGGLKDLMRMASHIFSRPLNRAQPLWEITFVDGLDQVADLPKGCFALISKIHHAAIDGISGMEIMGAILDPKGTERELERDRWRPEKPPTEWDLVREATGQALRTPGDLMKFVTETLYKAGRIAAHPEITDLALPPMPMTAPRTRFNDIVSPHRVFGGVHIDLKRIKTLKNKLRGVTINDIVLTLCGGAIRRYLQEKDGLPPESLTAMVPISMRSNEQSGSMGNQVSAMLVDLGTKRHNPLERLRVVHQSTRGSKVYSTALSANHIMDLVPGSTAALAARLYSRMHLAKRHKPFYNLVITNVPGPQFPLQLGTTEMVHSLGMAPITDGQGMILVVTSYNGQLTISATACPEMMPDLQVFLGYLEWSLEDLEQTAEKEPETWKTSAAIRRSENPNFGQALEDLRAALNQLQSGIGQK
jgi:WS/DGAT/MGAT family acyltransferase